MKADTDTVKNRWEKFCLFFVLNLILMKDCVPFFLDAT